MNTDFTATHNTLTNNKSNTFWRGGIQCLYAFGLANKSLENKSDCFNKRLSFLFVFAHPNLFVLLLNIISALSPLHVMVSVEPLGQTCITQLKGGFDNCIKCYFQLSFTCFKGVICSAILSLAAWG